MKGITVFSRLLSLKKETPFESSQSGEGIKSLKTSGVFRTLNFELYVRPNKMVMAFGVIAISFCGCYMGYMRYYWKKEQVYTALNDSDELILRKKSSHWD
ncbi:small integral membrane protein 8 [Lepeophtheirus salmonis]|uniref:small integral membrane protein 8 n=1 Tax=Lepeophtheirus salmonis TaxID=72036 RepID=UPI001AE584D2|nr:small integral membrane protein 8-like [Lepeophtheirus salmonis]